MADKLALDYMGYYPQLLTKSLFIHSLEKNNKQFIENSLKIGVFDNQIFKE